MDKLTFKAKLHAHGWFILCNAIIAILIACRYFTYLPKFPSDPYALLFLVSSLVSQMTLLIAIFGALCLPAILLPKWLRRTTVAVIAALGLSALVIDTFVFAQYRFHINPVVLEMVLSGQVVSFPISTWLTVIAGVVALLAGQVWMISKLEQQPKLPVMQRKLGRKYALLVFVSLLVSHATHIWAAANVYQPVTMLKRYLPVFHPTTANDLLKDHGWVDVEAIERQKALRIKTDGDLHYPTQPLQVEVVEKPLNIMILAVDSWRGDTFNADNTPNMWRYAQRGQVLNNHIASGNATRMGIFGLFYGIPGTYWHSFLANGKTPVLMDRLQELDYDLGIFAAAYLTSPEFNQTVFAEVPNLRIKSQGSRPSELDQSITDDWLAWYDKRDKSKPAFSFLFYDSPHGYDFPKDYSHKYEPYKPLNYLQLNNDSEIAPLMNFYKTSVHYTDSLAGKVLDKLAESGDLDNTIVIITADHGQELNDNKLNYWGHNSNYTDPQVRVPFAIFGPGINANSIKLPAQDTLTSHEDVVPTLMKNYLGVTSDVETYSTGVDLMSGGLNRDWVMSSMWASYAIISNERIFEVGIGGQTSIVDKTNREIEAAEPNYQNIQSALERMSRFNK